MNACFATWKSHWTWNFDLYPHLIFFWCPLTSPLGVYPVARYWSQHYFVSRERNDVFGHFGVIPDVSPVIPSSMVRSLMMRLFEIHPAFHRYRAACKHFVNSSRKRMLCGLGMLGHPVHRTKNPGFKNQRHAGCLRNRAPWWWITRFYAVRVMPKMPKDQQTFVWRRGVFQWLHQLNQWSIIINNY